ncbi:MAG: GMC family oxidoreductase N-terminal domain-containing protein [Actinomycetota bacterium]
MIDILIVGAGGGGPVAAYELARAGLSVTLLEAGRWNDPDRDYTRLEDDMGSLLDGRLRWGPGDRAKSPWTRRRDGVGLILQCAGVGGTTLHYNGISPRAYPAAFENGEWPFDYDELLPFYEQVEEFLPVALVSDLATKDAIFAEGCEGAGLKRSETKEVTEDMWRPCHNAILPIAQSMTADSLRWPEVDGCTMCGHCLQGCPNPQGAPLERKAKRATNVSYVPAAVETGRCEVMPNAFATAILQEEIGGRFRARGVRYRDTDSGEVREIEARVTVLAAGAIESPRLWLNSGLPQSGAVGRYLTTHYQDFVTGIFPNETHPDVGQVTMARADFPGQGTIFTQGFGPQSYAAVLLAGGKGFWDEPTGDEPWDVQGKMYGAAANRLMTEYSHSLTITICTDDEADASNGVALADDWPADEHGAIPKVTYHPTTTTVERESFLARRAAEILRAAGAREVHRSNMAAAFLTHIMSTLRIGTDPSTSACDAGGEAHTVERLFVADSAALANGLGGPNPTLTVQALAARTAGEISRRYFG